MGSFEKIPKDSFGNFSGIQLGILPEIARRTRPGIPLDFSKEIDLEILSGFLTKVP